MSAGAPASYNNHGYLCPSDEEKGRCYIYGVKVGDAAPLDGVGLGRVRELCLEYDGPPSPPSPQLGASTTASPKATPSAPTAVHRSPPRTPLAPLNVNAPRGGAKLPIVTHRGFGGGVRGSSCPG